MKIATQRAVGRQRPAFVFSLLVLFSLCLGVSVVTLQAQSKTTVTGTVLGPDGTQATGFVSITATNAFTSSDGYNVAPGPAIHVTVSSGAFSIALIPNDGSTTASCSTPSVCSYYRAVFNLTSTLGNIQYAQTWEVPSSGPVAYQSIVVTSQPPPSLTLPMAQVSPPSGCVGGQNPQWTGTGWTCESQPYDAGMFWSGTVTQANQLMARIVFTRTVTFPVGLTNSLGTAKEGATGSTIISFSQNGGAAFGTCTFAASGGANQSCTFASASGATLNSGDILTVTGPASADATLGDISITLAGTR